VVRFGADLAPFLEKQPGDVLLLDISVPISLEDHNPFPILYFLPRLLSKNPGLRVLVISEMNQPVLIEALSEVGISGYIFKNDQASIERLAEIVLMIASGGIYFSGGAYQRAHKKTEPLTGSEVILTSRQLEVLSLCAANPDATTLELSTQLGIAGSTVRTLLSKTYARLSVRTRAAALARAQQLGLLAGLGISINQNRD
jgi:DNA-binding NarL/FixJ family response regulator